MLSFKSFLKEYLTPEQEANFSHIKMTTKARKATDPFFGKNNDIVKENIKESNPDKSEIHRAVEQHLGQEISHEDYKVGKMTDQHGRQVKIGGKIKDEKLRNQFANDNTRAGTKSTSGVYATVVRGTQVAGQTNSVPDELHPSGHSWGEQSCKNIESGCNRHYLPDEVKHGSVVVRMHDHDGKEIYRATLHPHHNEQGHVAYAVNSEYGIKHPDFTAHAHDVARRLSGEHKGGSLAYKIHPKVYNDNQSETILHPNVTSEHISHVLNDPTQNFLVKKAAIGHPNATKDHISHVLNDPTQNFLVKKAAIKHKKATSEHISQALSDPDSSVREYALGREDLVTKDHIDKALGDKDIDVRLAAIKHKNATKGHVDKALKDENEHVRLAAVRHQNATSEHIDKALNDESPRIRNAALDLKNERDDQKRGTASLYAWS